MPPPKMRGPSNDSHELTGCAATSRWRGGATMLVSTILLSSAALYNRFPMVWPDTGGYLVGRQPDPFSQRPLQRVVYPAHWTGTLWPVVIAQSALYSYLLRLGLREVFGIASRSGFLVLVASLCVLSSLPWYTGFLMADIFAPMLVLGLFLMVFCADRLNRWENWFVLALRHPRHKGRRTMSTSER